MRIPVRRSRCRGSGRSIEVLGNAAEQLRCLGSLHLDWLLPQLDPRFRLCKIRRRESRMLSAQ